MTFLLFCVLTHHIDYICLFVHSSFPSLFSIWDIGTFFLFFETFQRILKWKYIQIQHYFLYNISTYFWLQWTFRNSNEYRFNKVVTSIIFILHGLYLLVNLIGKKKNDVNTRDWHIYVHEIYKNLNNLHSWKRNAIISR